MGAMKARVVAAREAADEARRNYTGVTQPDEVESGSDRHTEALSGDPAVILVDGNDRYEVYYRTDAWHASMEWARFHGLDPMSIPRGAVVERDGKAREIRFESFVKTGPNLGDIEIDGLDPVIMHRVERGEGILPLPVEVTRGKR